MTVWLNYLGDFATDLNVAAEKAKVKPLFTPEEIDWIKIAVRESVESSCWGVPGGVSVSLEQPQGTYETIQFGGTAPDDNTKGLAPIVDYWNGTAGETADVYPENFDDEIAAAVAANRRVDGTARALANVAAHELGHTFGLDHFNCYGDPTFDPQNTDDEDDEDEIGDQNEYIMCDGTTGVTPELAITPMWFSPMSIEMLRFGQNGLGGREIVEEQGTGYGTHGSAASSEPLGLSQQQNTVVKRGSIARSGDNREMDWYSFAGREGDLLTLLLLPSEGVGLSMADAQGGFLPAPALRGQLPEAVCWEALGDNTTFGQAGSSEDLSCRGTAPMLLNVILPDTAAHNVIVCAPYGGWGNYDLFAWLSPGGAQPGPPDIAVTGFRADGENLLVDYQITGDLVDEFDVGVYRSANGSSLDALLMSQHVDHPTLLVPGNHTLAVVPDFNDPKADYYLLAKLDYLDAVEETNEDNNVGSFGGGVFIDRPHKIVHAQGIDAAGDTVGLSQSPAAVDVAFSVGPGFYSYDPADVLGIHIRTHDGNDEVAIVGGLAKPLWVFGGEGNDVIEGGGGNDWLYGGAGSDVIEGGGGNDYLYGEMGNDLLRGDAGGDYLCGDDGNDTLEGGAGDDDLSGGEGNDTYVFAGYGDLGSDDVSEPGGGYGDQSVDTLDFHDLIPGYGGYGGYGICLDLSYTELQYVAGNLALTLDNGYGLEDVFGTAYGDYVMGNLRDNLLYGGDGDDVLNVVDGYGGDAAIGGYGEADVAYGDYGDYLDVEYPYYGYGLCGGGDSPSGGELLPAAERLDALVETLRATGLEDPTTLDWWRGLVAYYADREKLEKA